MKKTAIVLGSSGLVGSELLSLLLNNDAFSGVKIFVRKPLGINHAKLTEIQTDFESLSTIREEVNADVIFSCLGSTKRKTPNPEDYYRVDHFYSVWFAEAGRARGVQQFHIVSSIGANKKSGNFYLKLKGKTENDILKENIETTCIYRPSLITGKRKEKRPAEDIAKLFYKLIDPLLAGGLKKYKSIDAKEIAQAMINQSLKNEKGAHVFESHQIKRLAKG